MRAIVAHDAPGRLKGTWCYHARHGGPGPVRAAERIHGFRALRALLRRVLRRARPDPGRLLARAHLRRDDSVRYGSFAPRRPGAPAKRPARTLHGRGLARAPARPRGSRARPRGHGRALTPALRPPRGGGALPQVRVGPPER